MLDEEVPFLDMAEVRSWLPTKAFGQWHCSQVSWAGRRFLIGVGANPGAPDLETTAPKQPVRSEQRPVRPQGRDGQLAVVIDTQKGEGAGPRRERAHPALDHPRRLLPVNPAILLFDFRRVTHAFGRLRPALVTSRRTITVSPSKSSPDSASRDASTCSSWTPT